MTVKIYQGLVSNSQAFREIKGAKSSISGSTSAGDVVTQSQRLMGQTRALSDAVVTSLKSRSSNTDRPEKIREFQEAREVSKDVAERIREDDEGALSHQGLKQASPETLAN